MKNLLLLAFSVILLCACDPSYSTEYSVVNNTEQSARVIFYDENKSEVGRAGGVYHYRQDTTSTKALGGASESMTDQTNPKLM